MIYQFETIKKLKAQLDDTAAFITRHEELCDIIEAIRCEEDPGERASLAIVLAGASRREATLEAHAEILELMQDALKRQEAENTPE